MAKRALIVDDIPFSRKVIGKILTDSNISVVAEASNGTEAIEEYAKHIPDFVLMDVVMPKKNGIEACRQIIEKYPDAKIVMISALTQEQLLMDAINAGARDYIIKPFAPEDLIRSIIKIFEGDGDEDLQALAGS